MNSPDITQWSAGYALVSNIDVQTWNDDEAAVPGDLYEMLAMKFGKPVVGYVGGLHYYLKPEHGIPAQTVAVPKHNHKSSEPDEFLIQK